MVLLLLGFLVCYWIFPSSSPSSRPHSPHKQPLSVLGPPAIHYTPSGDRFVVEGKEKMILSGAIHYFRVVPAYWKDRLLKLKAAGLNTVET